MSTRKPPTRDELLVQAFDALEMNSEERALTRAIDQVVPGDVVIECSIARWVAWSFSGGHVTLSLGPP